MSTNLKTLISKLNDTTRSAAERAANLTLTRGHYEVDVEHLFLALLEQPRSDLAVLCRRFDIATGFRTESFLDGRSCCQRLACLVIDDLSIDVIHATEHRKTRPLGSAADFLTNAAVNSCPDICSTFLCHISIVDFGLPILDQI